MGLLIYLITLAIIVVASNQSIFYKVSEIFKDREKATIQIGFTVCLGLVFTLCYVLNGIFMKEGFFFVAPQNPILGRNIPRKAIYDGKPITFEFDSVGSGMIKGCPNGRYYGTENTDDSIL